ncbi:MAG: hypothetical protein HYS80_02200 [Candidatus Aenigmarchaeota archaeon]|nr:hypothetical protein [Candidatus Aenigmarchaeota archaeon]
MPIKITEKRFADEVWGVIASSPEGVSKNELETKVKRRLQLKTEFPYEFWMLFEKDYLLSHSLVIDSDEIVGPNLPDKIFYHSGDSRKLLKILDEGLTGRYYESRPQTVFLSSHPSTSFKLRRANREYHSFMVEVDQTISERLDIPIIPVNSLGVPYENSHTYGAHKSIPPSALRTVYLIGKQTKLMKYLLSEVRLQGFDVDIVENPEIPGRMDRIVAEYHGLKP